MSDVLTRGSAVPLYVQLEQIFRAKIASGEWAAGQRIPSENELDRTYGVSRMTARGVLTTMVNDGVLFRVPGKGTFVRGPKIEVSPAYRGVREQLEAMGYDTRTELIGIETRRPERHVRDQLRLDDDAQVYAIRRVRSTQGGPVSLHHSFVPAHLAPDLDTHDVVAEQLCVVLRTHYGLDMKHVDERLEAISAGREEARHLGLGRGAPALLLEDTISDRTGRPFEYSRIVFRGDKVRLGFHYDL